MGVHRLRLQLQVHSVSNFLINQNNFPFEISASAQTSSISSMFTTVSPYKCGDLLPFIGNDVSQLGFNSGTFYDGSTIYVGTADFGQW